MKKIIPICVFFVLAVTTFAQPIPLQSIEETVIGWTKVFKFKGVKAPQKVDDKFYSAAQLSICDTLGS